MVKFTENEKRALLIIFKDFSKYYNSNSLSKKLEISRVGTMKILKNLDKNNILKKIVIGKSSVYRINLENDYVRDTMAFLLSDEANNFNRWKNEFKELLEGERVVMMYGSALINYSKANDIDIMVIENKKSSIIKIINEKQKVLPKKIHLIEISEKEFLDNLEKQKSIIEIARTAVILYGQSKYVEVMKNVKSNI
ncbi:MAG: nucleotidyltransferase domain-containing protein [archaeon]